MAGDLVLVSRGNTHSTDDVCWQNTGFSTTNTDSFTTDMTGSVGQPYGVTTHTNGSPIIADLDDAEYKLYDGFSSTVDTTIAGEATRSHGCAWDGTNLIGADDTTDIIYLHTGFTTTTTDTVDVFTNVQDAEWDGTDLIAIDYGTPSNIERFTGFSSTADTNYADANDGVGVGWDGANAMSVEFGTATVNMAYLFVGFTSSVTTSIDVNPDTSGTFNGLTDDSWTGATTTSTSTSSSTTTTSTSTSTTTTSTSSSTSTTTTSTSSSTSTSTTTTSTSSSTSTSTTTTSTSSSTSTSTTTTSTSSSTSTSTTTTSTSTSSSTSTTTTSTSSSTSTSTTTTSTSSSTSTSTTTTTTLDPSSGGLSFGEQNPTEGEIAESWQTFSDGAAGTPTIVGDADWGKMQLDLDEEGKSRVYDFGDATSRTYTLTENRYGSGQGTATLQIRGDTSPFAQDDGEPPTWANYSVPTAESWRYIQVREINN